MRSNCMKTLLISLLFIFSGLFAQDLECPPIEMENKTDQPFNKMDYRVLSFAQNDCKAIPNNPCVIKFIKVAPQIWDVDCGKELKFKDDE